MQYQAETEKVAMMDARVVTPRPLLLTEDRDIQRTRKILLIILGVCFALSVAGMISPFSDVQVKGELDVTSTRRNALISESLISMLLYGFGIFVAYRYLSTGLRVFAWLGVVILVVTGIMATLLFLLAIGALALINHTDDSEMKTTVIGASVGIIVLILANAVGFILTVIIVKFTFKLARLIDANKHLITQQV